MSKDNNERMVATVISAPTAQDKLENKVRYMLDQLTAEVQMPYGMVLEGRVTTDNYGNQNLYVFLKRGWDTFPVSIGNVLPRPESVTGGKWINLRRPFNPSWEAIDIQAAIKRLTNTTTTR